MKSDNLKLLQNTILGQIGQMNGIFSKVLMENLLGDFTKNGGVSALSALFLKLAVL